MPSSQSCPIITCIRIRPSTHTLPELINVQKNTLHISHPNAPKSSKGHWDFAYDHIFTEESTQQDVYRTLGHEMLLHVLSGYNITIFAYGQTASGKTYTMMGPHANMRDESRGIIPRICDELFDLMEERKRETPSLRYTIETSMLEVYNEKIRDLLNPTNAANQTGLNVREHPNLGPIIIGLSTNVVNSSQEIRTILREGASYRAIARTNMNDSSSRSHTIFQITLTQTKMRRNKKTGEMEATNTVSKINLVDLAGSERSTKSTQMLNADARTQRLQEGNAINLSLTTLGICITNLAKLSSQSKKKSAKEIFVPYRDSKLTFLLRDSLGGNSRCAMAACISPLASDFHETLSTLRYAHQAKKIKNKARVNRDPNMAIISQLKAEIAQLKEVLRQQGIVTTDVALNAQEEKQTDETPAEKKDAAPLIRTKSASTLAPTQSNPSGQKEDLLRALAESQRIIHDLQMSDSEKKERTKQIQEARQKALTETGITVKLLSDTFGFSTRSTPHLLNLNEDPSMNECLLFFFREGETSIGASPQNDIVLKGVEILPQHCKIRRQVVEQKSSTPSEPASRVFLVPLHAGTTPVMYVNGCEVSHETELHHLDRVIIGSNHVFRFNSPVEAQRSASSNRNSLREPIDWKYAQEELRRQHVQQYEQEMRVLEEQLQLQKHDAQLKLDSEIRALEAERQRVQLERKMEQSRPPPISINNTSPTTPPRKARDEESPATPATPTNPLTSPRFSLTQRLFQRRKQLTQETSQQQVKQMRSGIMEILPSLKEANSMATQMGKNVKYVLKIQLGKNDKPECGIQVVNYFANTVSMWQPEKFLSRLSEMRDLFFHWSEARSYDHYMSFKPPSYAEDPFYNSNHLLIGRCSVPLLPLTQGKSSEFSLIVEDANGEKQGTLDIELELLSDTVLTHEDSIGRSFSFLIHIHRLHSTAKRYVREASVEYQFYDDSCKQTAAVSGENVMFGFAMEYCIPYMSTDILDYLQSEKLEFVIRGELFDQFARGVKSEPPSSGQSSHIDLPPPQALNFDTGIEHNCETASLSGADLGDETDEASVSQQSAMRQLAQENEMLRQQLLEMKRKEELQKRGGLSPSAGSKRTSLAMYKTLTLRCFEAVLPSKGFYYAKVQFNDQKHKTIISKPKSQQAHWTEKFVLDLSSVVEAYDTIQIRIMKKNAIRRTCVASIMVPLIRLHELSGTREGCEWFEVKSSDGSGVIKLRLGARLCF